MKSIKIVALIFLVCVSFALLLSFASAAVLSVHSSQCTYCAEKGDMNGDGKVGLDDAIYLLFHVNFPESYPLAGCENTDFDAEPKPLLAGYAERDFTPTVMGGVMPGASYVQYAKKVELPLSASAVALECGDDSLILISMDLLRFASNDAAFMRQKITAATGVPGENIMIVATHTHTSIALNVKYNLCEPDEEIFNHATDMAVEAATAAWNTREGAKIGSGTTTLEGYSFCREAYMTSGKVQTWPTNASKIDRLISIPDQSVNVIRMDDLNGEVKGLVVNYANHPDTTPDGGYNSDWPGYMRKVLKEEYGEELVIVFLNGANGDVNHYDYLNSTDGDREYKSIGTALANKVIELCNTMTPDEEFPVLKASSEIYEAPMRTITQEQLEWAQEKLNLIENGGSVSNLDKKFAVEYTTTDYSRYGDTYEIEIQTLVLGDFALVGLPCQPYSEIGHKIREKSPYENTMIVSLANGEYGYVTPDSLLGTDSYGARFSIYTSRSGYGTADLLIDHSVAMLKKLKK